MSDDFERGKRIALGMRQGALSFVALAQTTELFDDVTLAENADLFPEWSQHWTGKVNTIVRDPDDGALYRKVNADFSAPYPQSQPSKDKSQWKLVGDPGEEWPEWSQSLGAHDAYGAEAKVRSVDYSAPADKTVYKWSNSYGSGNIWRPGEFGWMKEGLY